MITVSEKAVKQLQEILRESSNPDRGLRLVVERGGCAGWQYAMKIDDQAAEDVVVEQDGVRVFLAPDSVDLLRESQVDYVDDLSDTGFKIVNPNAARTCGCGSSFEAAEEGKEPVYDSSMDGTQCGDEEPS